VRMENGEIFEPVEGCNGNCLNCHFSDKEPVCGIPDLKKADAWKLRDYRRWSKLVEEGRVKQSILEV